MSGEVKLMPCPPFQIGDEVAVIPDCDDWASDWQDIRLWIAAIHALPGGGFDYWVCDAWPLPDKPALTDGFYMGREDEPDTLTLVAPTRPTVVTDEVVERVKSIQALALAPGKFSGPTFDEIWALADEALALMGGR